jgi:hypothetical protein
VRVKTVRLAWFRGAADPVALEADGRSMVVYGQNGAGKSSFVDAVEYVVKDGKLAHLTHEYSGRNQEKAIRNTHTPAGQSTEFWITFQDDAELHVKIAPNGTHTNAGAQGINMGAWDYRRTVLRQDEVAEFIRSSKGGKYSALLPLFGLHELEVAAENVRQLARAVEQQSKLGHKQGALQELVIKRQQVFGNDTDAAIKAKIAALHTKYSPQSKAAAPLARCNEVEAALTQRINELSAENQCYVALRAVAEADLAGKVKAVRDSNAKLAGSVEPLIAEKLTVLQSADAFAAKLKDDGKVACPACGRPIPVGEFKAHVETEQERLQEILAIFDKRKIAISTLIDGLKTAKTTLAKAELKVWRCSLNEGPLKANMKWLEQCTPEGFRRSVSEDDLKAIEEYTLPVIKATDAASQDAPPNMKDLSRDKTLAEAAKAVFESNALSEEIAQIEGLIAFIKSAETSTPSTANGSRSR